MSNTSRTQLGQYAHDYLVSYAEERLVDVDVWGEKDLNDEQREWLSSTETSLTRHLEQAVEGFMMDVDLIPGEELPDAG